MREQADQIKMQYYQGSSKSDHITMFKFYRQWKLCGRSGSKQFAWDKCLSHSALEQIDGMCKQFYRALRDIQFVEHSYNFDRNLSMMKHPLDENSGSHRLVKAILTAGLYPNVIKVKMPRKKLSLFLWKRSFLGE